MPLRGVARLRDRGWEATARMKGESMDERLGSMPVDPKPVASEINPN